MLKLFTQNHKCELGTGLVCHLHINNAAGDCPRADAFSHTVPPGKFREKCSAYLKAAFNSDLLGALEEKLVIRIQPSALNVWQSIKELLETF